MKARAHAIAGCLAFLLALTFVNATLFALLAGSPATLVRVKRALFWGVFLLPPLLAGAGATGMQLLGSRTAPLGLTKQKRGPIGFMTSLLVLIPCAWFLSSRAASGRVGGLFYTVQAVELAASGLVLTLIGLNIRDGLALRGRISRTRASAPVIEQRDGGPLVVLQAPSLTSADGEALTTKPVLALCRCGQSKNKPYCDGSHAEVGFDSAPSDDRTKDEVLVYEGEEVSIHYNRLLCSHAAECGRRQKAAFDSSRSPWIVPDNAPRKALLEVVQACPSGALRYQVEGGAPQHAELPAPSGITIERNGPYRVSGIPLAAPRPAQGAHPQKYVLCRCGASKNKPYCDGSHFDIGWTG